MVAQIQLESKNIRDNASRTPTGNRSAPKGVSFSSVLGEAMPSDTPDTNNRESIRFSAHAAARMVQRSIALDASDHADIARALDEAAAKGSKESLLIMDGLSLVASVPNRTIITAVPRGETADTVFTNIDSAVVVAKASTATETME